MKETRVFVYYTGGTIGMVPGKSGEEPVNPGDFTAELRRHPELFDKEDGDWFVLPSKATADCPEQFIVKYQVEEVKKPIDSSKITPQHWEHFTNKILEKQTRYDGFVLLHGTDTLAYTSSALSFLLKDFKKPVVITGAQRSVFEPRSDAVENILGSLLIAGCYCETPALQLVSVLFDNMVFQGNRVTKVDCSAFHAFSSPNSLPLVELGVTIKVNAMSPSPVPSPSPSPSPSPCFSPLLCSLSFSDVSDVSDVRVLRLFPGIKEEYVRSVLSGAGGVILETYGSGNAPDDKWFLDSLKQANRHGVFLLNVTQVLQGSVMPIYQTSKGLREAGVLSGYDITSEAALTKMIWTLKKYTTQDQRKKALETSVCGEMTVTINPDPPLN
ncbi:L-asparaginase 1-like [Acipenser oxyrinchus oxyrinchus]|uniref:asparaginase n=1 Tax=Acipenser oxyrinchus oxyrinchus TaxID=40147 RepID=A0AAD8CRB1_ACIOX|nr:L-asparaginase 1-like [Acipenser oxyrinchus oxyrinchus]